MRRKGEGEKSERRSDFPALRDELVERMRSEFPGFDIKFKEEGYSDLAWPYRFATWFVDAMYNTIRLFNPSFSNTMMSYITVFENEIWFPSRERFFDDKYAYWTYRTLRHERAHLLDRRDRMIWFSISYVLLLPIFYTMRSHWEFRGYVQDLLVEYESTGSVSEKSRERIVTIMVTGGYAWMMAPWRRSQARKKVDSYVEQIERGEVRWYSLHGEAEER